MFNLFKKKQTLGTQLKIKIDGMHCSSCSMNIDGTLEELPGVIASQTNYARSVAVVEYDDSQLKPADILQAIEELGYQAAPA